MADTIGGPGPATPPSAASRSTTPKLFVRQSSGLVRNVSVTNALFFNVAAFVGVGLTLYPIFYSLAGVPVWKAGPFSEYGWAAIIAGLFCILLALIFSSLTSVMPRSGGDYVFTSRIIHPFLGWMESWTLVIASVLIIAFEVPLVLRNLQITARIIGIGAGGFSRANGWFTDSSGSITGFPGFAGSIVVLILIGVVCVLPTRSFHRSSRHWPASASPASRPCSSSACWPPTRARSTPTRPTTPAA